MMLLSVSACLHVMVGRGSGNYVKPRITRAMLKEVVGAKGVLLSEGVEHARQRRILKPLFDHGSILRCGNVFRECGRRLVKGWLEDDGEWDKFGWKEVEVHDGVAQMAMTAIARVILGVNVENSGLGENYKRFLERHNVSHLAIVLYFLFPPEIVNHLPLKEIQSARELLRNIRRELLDVTRCCRKENCRTEDSDFAKKPQCFLESLLLAKDVESDEPSKVYALNDEEIVDQILTFMGAGQVTTAVCVSWAFFLLGLNPSYQQQLYDDLKEQVSDENMSDKYWLRNLDSVPLLDAILHECLRLYPAINMTAREALADDVICGHCIPRGTIVSIPMMAIHRSKYLWGEDANCFRPERFLDKEETAKRNRSQWMPFLYGNRSCLGSRLAMLEMKAMLAVAVSKCEFEVAPGCEPDAMGVILVPKCLRLKVRVRNEGPQ